MKLIKACIRYRKSEGVYNALKEKGYSSVTFVECEGTGQYSDQEKEHVSEKYPFADAYKVVKLEILAADEHIGKIVGIIKENGRTGYHGGGMIIVSPVDEVYKVRTDDTGILSI